MAAMGDDNETAIKAECQNLKVRIAEIIQQCNQLKDVSSSTPGASFPGLHLQERRTLRGHFGKIYAMYWAADNPHVLSAAQDGKMIIWNAMTANKLHAIPLRSSWVMTCAFSPNSTMAAAGGLDNMCSIYKVNLQAKSDQEGEKVAYRELAQHEGYLSCCRFLSNEQIVTSSGDSTCILWDIEAKQFITQFADHSGDVMSVSVMAGDNGFSNDKTSNLFVSGSCDATVKLWDVRSNRSVFTFIGHESDVNAVQWFPDGWMFGTGSDDSSCRLFDIRSNRQLNVYQGEKIMCSITSVGFTNSGKFLVGGYDDSNCYLWNTCTGAQAGELHGHTNRISSLGVRRDGHAIASGSWDFTLKVWA